MPIVEREVDGVLYKTNVVELDAVTGAGTTAQTQTDDPTLATPDDAIIPPLPLEQLQRWTQMNGTRKACIDAIARNTVGLGYTIETARTVEQGRQDPREQLRECEEWLEDIASRDRRLDAPGLIDLLLAVKWDEEEVGWGFLEVSRNRIDGHVDGLYHLPAVRMRRLQDRSGYMELSPDGDENNATYYAPFGRKVVYENDRPTAELAPGHQGGWARNEVIVFRLHSTESRDYGAPRDSALALEYLGDKLSNEANAAYFENGGAMPSVLFIQGEENRQGGVVNVQVPVETTQRINSVLRSRGGTGAGGSGRVAIVPLPAGVKAQKEVLGEFSDRDVGFVNFRADMRQRTLSSFRMSPIFIALPSGAGGAGQYDAEVDRAITKEQVFDPEQSRYERRLRRTLLEDHGFGDLTIAFRDLAVENDAAKRSATEKGAEVGVVTRREFRSAHGWPPIPEAAKDAAPEPGQVPFGWNDELIAPTGLPAGAENRVAQGDGQQGERPGIGGRGTRDRGQAASAQAARLAGRVAGVGAGGARRAVERAATLPEG